MTRPSRGLAALAALALLSAPPVARAQRAFGVSLRSGEAGATYDGWRQEYGSGAEADYDTYRQWLQIPLGGFAIDPRIVTFSVTLRPTFSQQGYSTQEDGLDTRHLGYDFGIYLLQGKRVSATLTGSRMDGSLRGGSGGNTDFQSSGLSSSLYLRTRYLPVTAGFSSTSVADSWRGLSGSERIRRNETTSTWRIAGQGSKLSLQAERMSLTNHATGTDFTVVDALARHTLRWGKGSSLLSTLSHTDRGGADGYGQFAWSERAHLQHTLAVSSTYSFDHRAWEQGGRTGKIRSFGVGSQARVFSWLSAGVNGTIEGASQGQVQQTIYAVDPRLNLEIRLPLGARLAAGATAVYQRSERTGGSQLALEAIGERHEVEPIRGFALNHPLPEAASVVVRSEDGTQTYLEEVDYRLVETGEFLQVQVLPGGRIEPGDVLRISYRYRLPPESGVEVLGARYDAGLSLGPLNARHGRASRRQRLLSGTVVAPPREEERWTSLGLRGNTFLGRMDLQAEDRRRHVRSVDYTSQQARATLAPPPLFSRLATSLGLSADRTLAADRELRTFSAVATADWKLTGTLHLRGRGDAWLWRDGPLQQDRRLSGDLTVHWTIGSTDLVASYASSRRRGLGESTDDRVSLRLVRRF